MKPFFCALLFFFWTGEARSLSLLFSSEEEAHVLHSLGRGQPNSESVEEREPALSGLLFLSPSDWCLWLDGKKCTPKACDSRYQILRVSRQEVLLKSEGVSLTLKPKLSQKTFQEAPSQDLLDPVE